MLAAVRSACSRAQVRSRRRVVLRDRSASDLPTGVIVRGLAACAPAHRRRFHHRARERARAAERCVQPPTTQRCRRVRTAGRGRCLSTCGRRGALARHLIVALETESVIEDVELMEIENHRSERHARSGTPFRAGRRAERSRRLRELPYSRPAAAKSGSTPLHRSSLSAVLTRPTTARASAFAFSCCEFRLNASSPRRAGAPVGRSRLPCPGRRGATPCSRAHGRRR